jgi:hydroxymethylpyrimidine pyrophosphatase-like HAD family hydrolase
MALGLARAVTATGTALGLHANWFVADRWLASGLDAYVLREIDVVGVRPTVCDLLAEQEPPDKILFMAEPDAVGPLDELHAALPEGVAAQTSNPAYLEITAAGVDKGAALAALAAELGHDAAQVLAIGDGPNDLSMFAFAGVSVAMANARPEVLAAADFVAVSNLENGLGRVLDAIMLA